MHPRVHAFFDEATNTATYVVAEAEGSACAIIDSVLDFDYASGATDTRSADAVIAFVRAQGFRLEWILETHVHADHLSAAPYLQEALGGKLAIGQNITVVQDTFGKVFNEGTRFARDGSQFDKLLKDGDSVMIGQMRAEALHTPGHTPACMTFVIGDAAFVGDTLFMPDYGTARADFPGGSAESLYHSIRKILALPPETKIFVGHDYLPSGRSDYRWETSVSEQRHSNIHVHDGISEAQFVEMRTKRDATLEMPVLILPAVQINIRAGELPPKEDNGIAYAKIPLNAL